LSIAFWPIIQPFVEQFEKESYPCILRKPSGTRGIPYTLGFEKV
jgi:hypothetical protein